MNTVNAPVVEYKAIDLKNEWQEALAQIKRIKEEVSVDFDNINYPEPFLAQSSVEVYHMVEES